MHKVDILTSLKDVQNSLTDLEPGDALDVVEDLINDLESDPEVVSQNGRK